MSGGVSTYDLRGVLDRIAPQRIAGDFNGGADDHAEEVPRTVFDDSQVEDPNEHHSVENGCEDGEGKGWAVHPDGLRWLRHLFERCAFGQVVADRLSLGEKAGSSVDR